MLSHHFIFATGIIPQYADSVARGFDAFTKFIRTAGKGAALSRLPGVDLYILNHIGIIPASIVTLLILFSSFDPTKFVIWLPQIATIGGWLTFIFLLEPLGKKSWEKKLFGKNSAYNVFNAIVTGLVLGLFDIIVNNILVLLPCFVQLRKALDRRVFEKADALLKLGMENKSFEYAQLTLFVGDDKALPSPNGFHYALRGYVQGRIKGLPSFVMVLRVWWLAELLTAKLNEPTFKIFRLINNIENWTKRRIVEKEAQS